jgi:hypothetical protein
MRRAEVGHMLADMGVRLVFTGHTHFADIGFMQSRRGNLLCDISTPSVRFYPPRYRVAELTPGSTVIDCRCVDVAVPEGTALPEEDRDLASYYRRAMYEEYAAKMQKLPFPVRVAAVDNFISLVDEAPYYGELLLAVLGHIELPLLGNNGQILCPPALVAGIIFLRLRLPQNMAKEPGHHPALGHQIPVPALHRPRQALGNFPAHAGLLGNI